MKHLVFGKNALLRHPILTTLNFTKRPSKKHVAAESVGVFSSYRRYQKNTPESCALKSFVRPSFKVINHEEIKAFHSYATYLENYISIVLSRLIDQKVRVKLNHVEDSSEMINARSVALIDSFGLPLVIDLCGVFKIESKVDYYNILSRLLFNLGQSNKNFPNFEIHFSDSQFQDLKSWQFTTYYKKAALTQFGKISAWVPKNISPYLAQHADTQ